ncbi:MAG: ABC transporter ATP-binding protein [Rhizobiaceae bacterium]|nr:ABC transporter ATP-binding protein [Rhizobiaceae bacterium]
MMNEAIREAPILDVRQLEVVYNRVATAVQGVSISVAPREIVAMIGTNGAGKTTTLRAISGFLASEDVEITDGSVTFADRSIGGHLPHDIARRGIIIVPERQKVFETLNVEDNLLFNLSRSNRRICDQVYAYFPRLAERRAQKAGLLSGGEKQMLAIGMALMCEPKLLLVDELSLGLAPIVTDEIMRILQTINADLGLAMLIVEQNAIAALRIASFGYVMEGGRVVFKGSASGLMKHEDIKEFYLGGSGDSARSYRDLRQYSRKRRWWG